MLISISDLFKVDREKFDRTGAFNAILGADSELFVDPALVFKSKLPEFKSSKEKINNYFSNILLLLKTSEKKNDKFWREAVKLMTIPETKGLSIGYSDDKSDGNGIGSTLAKRIIEDAELIIATSKNNTYFFELLGLFEKGMGADRISDMIIHILLTNFEEYSKRICEDLEIDYETKCKTPNGSQIVILPQELLTNLPHSKRVFQSEISDESVRNVLNTEIGKSWKDAFSKEDSSEIDKHEVLNAFATNPVLFEAFVNEYITSQVYSYNFKGDPEGELSWYHEAKEIIHKKSKLYLKKSSNMNLDDTSLVDKVQTMCSIFKDLVENNGLDSLFYKDTTSDERTPKNEKAIQLVFYGICYFFCTQNNIDLTPESNTGSGPVDFKCSTGNEKVVIEVKKTLHSRLEHGYFVQLEKYKKSEKTDKGIFLLVIMDGKTSVDNYNKFKNKISNTQPKDLKSEIVYINAQKKKSASK